MKSFRMLPVAIAAFALAACAGTQTAMKSPAGTKSRVDQDYITAVEEAARRSQASVRVVWVNPPREKVRPE